MTGRPMGVCDILNDGVRVRVPAAAVGAVCSITRAVDRVGASFGGFVVTHNRTGRRCSEPLEMWAALELLEALEARADRLAEAGQDGEINRALLLGVLVEAYDVAGVRWPAEWAKYLEDQGA